VFFESGVFAADGGCVVGFVGGGGVGYLMIDLFGIGLVEISE